MYGPQKTVSKHLNTRREWSYGGMGPRGDYMILYITEVLTGDRITTGLY